MGRIADYSQVVTVEQLDGALRAGGFDAVCHYLGDDFALREEDPAVVAGIRALGWPQLGIFVPSLARVGGAGDAQRALWTYSFPPGSRHLLDVEPDEFAADPAGWAAAAGGWCDAMRAAGLSPGVYGTDATVAACGSRGDFIVRAVPGMCDPAGPGLDPAYFAGARAVQCLQGMWNRVVMDGSVSEFEVYSVTDSERIQAIYDNLLTTPVQRTGGSVGDLVADVYLQLKDPAGAVVPGGGGALVAILAALQQLQTAGVSPASLQPVLDAVAALRTDLDSLTLKRATPA